MKTVAILTLLAFAAHAAEPYANPDAGVYQVESAIPYQRSEDGGVVVLEPGWYYSNGRAARIEAKLNKCDTQHAEEVAKNETLAKALAEAEPSFGKNAAIFGTGVGVGVVLFVIGLVLVKK